MPTLADKHERLSRRQVDKFGARRAELAAAALRTLAERGYARTSLREIAEQSAFSHGVLHYYFADKADLITACVRQYKAECVTRYDQLVATAATPAELQAGFGEAMAATLRDEGHVHRLWYDLRAQSYFDDAFRADVVDIDATLAAMIWRVVARYAELAGTTPQVSPAEAYALLDGLFQQALLRQLTGEAEAAEALRPLVARSLALLVPAPPAS